MSWQQELEQDVRHILACNHWRCVPVTRSEAIILTTMVDVLSQIPEWEMGAFDPLNQDAPGLAGALARANDVLRRCLEDV